MKLNTTKNLDLKRIKIFGWISICLLSIVWYPLTAIYVSADIHSVLPVWFVALALILAFVCGTSIPDTVLIKLNLTTSLIFIFSAIFFCILIPFPYNISGLFFITSVTLGVLCGLPGFKRFSKILISTSSSAFICGVVLLLQTAIFPVFYLFASRYHSVEIIGPIINYLLNILGASSAFSSGHIYVHYADKVYSFVPSWELLGLYPFLNIMVGGSALLFLVNSPKRKYLILLCIILIYMIFHFILVTLTFIEVQSVTVFWRLDFLFITLLPLPFLLNKFDPFLFQESPGFLNQSLKKDYKSSTTLLKHSVTFLGEVLSYLRTKKLLGYIISLSLLLISSAGFFGFVDRGEQKQGRILIDEGHSDWEWTTDKFNTTWYGEQSTYNYWSLAQYLNYYFKVETKKEVLTDDLLKNYDILFIKTPTEPFSQSEIESIRRFVANGGGLLLIGDHTNVFGITTNLNPVASQFGMKFRYDCQYDLSGELSLFKKPVALPHPVVQYMPDFMFATSCMLDVPFTAENVIIGYGIKSIDADYSRPNFFPVSSMSSETMEFGVFVQAAGIHYGKGRVFLFADSTVWSNFFMFIPGKPELILGIIDWLNRRNGALEFLHLTFLLLAFGSLITSIVLGIFIDKRILTTITVLTGLIVAPITIHSFEQLNYLFYPIPRQHTNYLQVNFESEHSFIELPVVHLPESSKNSYHTFYVWLQRINIVPKLYSKYENALSKSEAVVVINPVKPFSLEEIQSTKEYVEKGGAFLLIDDPIKTNFTVSNNLLASLGVPVQMKGNITPQITIFRQRQDSLSVQTNVAGETNGGKGLLYCSLSLSSIPTNTEDVNSDNRFRLLTDKNIIQDYQKNVPNYFAQMKLKDDTVSNKVLKNHTTRIDHLIGNELNFKEESKIKQTKINQIKVIQDSLKISPVMSEFHIGKGKVVVLAASSFFTDSEMGFTTIIPNENQKKIYDLEFWIFQNVLGLNSN